MTELTKLPVTVITGFLGSGKTTLIRHLMQNAGGKRLAVVVNEFGDVGVDGEILKSCSIPDCPEENIMELANGCICCTVADDFIPTIEALMKLDPKPEHILIETSGLALPKPLLKAFDWPDIRSKITVDGVIALADAEAVAEGRFAPNVEALRRLLRFGGAHFIEFLYSLDDLHDRARLAVDDLELPRLTLVRHTENHYSLLCGAAFPGWGHVLVGILRVMADDYGALACLEHCGAKDQTETIDIRLVHTSYAQGRTFVLGQQPV